MRAKLFPSLSLFLAFSLLAGCASAIQATRKSIVVGVHLVAATAEMVDQVDQEKIAAATAKAKAGDPAGAQADLDKWNAQYAKIQKSLTVLWDNLRLAADTVTGIEDGEKKDLVGVLSDLVKATSDLSKALADAGVKVPGL